MGGKTFAVRLVSLALVLIVCLIALKSLLSGASGCARVLSRATYDGRGMGRRSAHGRADRHAARICRRRV